jgi:DNA-binding transcriptional ArsR family regulator
MESMGTVLDALGSAPRRRVLDIVKADPGCTVGQVASHFDVSRIAVMHQIRVLEEAQLLISQKEGRQRRLFFNAVPIQMIHDRWTSELSAFWAGRVADVKYRVEQKTTGKRRGKDGRGRKAGVAGPDQGKHRRRLA